MRTRGARMPVMRASMRKISVSEWFSPPRMYFSPTRPRAGFEHCARTVHVVAINLARIGGPEPVVARYVKDPRTTRDRPGHGVGLEGIAAPQLDRAALERPQAAGRAGQDPDAVTVGHEQARHIRSYEAGGAGDQHIHDGAAPGSAYSRRGRLLTELRLATGPSNKSARGRGGALVPSRGTLAPKPSDGPKSAYELAMERLRQKDREAGVEERPLSDQQKAAIAEARQVYQARMAEREILHRDALHKAQTREEVEKLESELAIDRDRLASDRDRKIAEIKQQPAK